MTVDKGRANSINSISPWLVLTLKCHSKSCILLGASEKYFCFHLYFSLTRCHLISKENPFICVIALYFGIACGGGRGANVKFSHFLRIFNFLAPKTHIKIKKCFTTLTRRNLFFCGLICV